MQLGKKQLEWLASLEAHPERQIESRLGKGTPDNYKACCLGEYGLICGVLEFRDGRLKEKNSNAEWQLLTSTWEQLGLRSPEGRRESGGTSLSLSHMNDTGYTWPQIAAVVRANPELFFTKSI